MRILLWAAAAVVAVVAAAALTGAPADAHHASAPFYDNTKSVTAEGVVTRFLFRNPHSFLFLDGEDENGETIAWEVEMGTAVSMSRRGWTPQTIQVGTASAAPRSCSRTAARSARPTSGAGPGRVSSSRPGRESLVPRRRRPRVGVAGVPVQRVAVLAGEVELGSRFEQRVDVARLHRIEHHPARRA